MKYPRGQTQYLTMGMCYECLQEERSSAISTSELLQGRAIVFTDKGREMVKKMDLTDKCLASYFGTLSSMASDELGCREEHTQPTLRTK